MLRNFEEEFKIRCQDILSTSKLPKFPLLSLALRVDRFEAEFQTELIEVQASVTFGLVTLV